MTTTDQDRIFAMGMMKLMAQHRLLNIEVDWPLGIAILSSLQLSLRHPGHSGHTAYLVRTFVDELIKEIETIDSPLAQLLRMGDDPQHDVPRAST